MKNLIKAQLFQIKKGKLILLTIVAGLFMQLVQVISGLVLDSDIKLSFAEFITEYSIAFYCFAAATASIVTVISVGGNFVDKTCNYEILNGHTRLEIFMGKSFVGIIAGSISYIVTLVVPYALSIAILGFGNELDAADVVLRLLLSLVVMIRISSVFIALTYMIRVYWVWIPVSFMYFVVGMEYADVLSGKSFLLGLSCFGTLSEYVSWVTYTLSDKVNYIYVYGRRILASESLGMIVSSVVIGAIALVVGYFFFKKDDLQ